MDERYVALFRGINVGKAKRVAMADLRAMAEDLGYRETRTLLNSGNLVFGGRRAKPESIARRLEQAMTEQLGVPSRTMVLTAEDFRTVVKENTLGKVATNPSRLVVAFCEDASRRKALAPLTRETWDPEALAVGSRAAYVWCPAGVLSSPLFDAVGRALGEHTTTRNWATVTKIAALLYTLRRN